MAESDVYSSDQVRHKLARDLPAWELADGRLCRTFRTADFRTALMLTNAIGHVAEQAWHHPDIQLGWGSVTVSLVSHDADGITDRDFELAARIDRFVDWQPPADSALTGTPDNDRWRYLVHD